MALGLWVVAVVALTIVISLALAQLFNQDFPLRRVVALGAHRAVGRVGD